MTPYDLMKGTNNEFDVYFDVFCGWMIALAKILEHSPIFAVFF